MTFFDVKNLLLCNDDFIGYKITLHNAVKRAINFTYEIHVRVHTNPV